MSMSPLTRLDRPLAGRAPAGGATFEDAFRRLFGERFPPLYRYLQRLSGDAALADDVAQETFVRLYERGTMPDAPTAWLVTVANNLLRDEHRRAARRRRLLTVRAEPAASERTPETEVLLSERATQVRRVLATLSPRHRQLLLLRHEGHSYDEIAAILGLAPGSVGTLLARATAAFVAAYGRTNDASE